MDLDQLLSLLINEQGLTEEEALKVAAARIRSQRNERETHRNANSIQRESPRSAVQRDPRAVDYGDETPEEAKIRWIKQEKEDPNGIYSIGGASAAGIFGQGAIPLEDLDPDAVGRNLQAHASMQQLKMNHRMLQELEEMSRLRRLDAAREADRRELDGERGPHRQLGKKRDR